MRSFAKEINGAKKAEYVESRRRLGITKERVFLVDTPMGTLSPVYNEGLNAAFMMSRAKSSSNPFDKYFLETIAKIYGADFTTIPAGPPPNLAFEWKNGKQGKSSTMIGAPVKDSGTFWQFCREMSSRYTEHGESRQRAGITLERVFFLHEAKMVAVYIEGDDPGRSMQTVMSSTGTYDKWFTDRASAIHGIDFRATPPPTPELLVAFDG